MIRSVARPIVVNKRGRFSLHANRVAFFLFVAMVRVRVGHFQQGMVYLGRRVRSFQNLACPMPPPQGEGRVNEGGGYPAIREVCEDDRVPSIFVLGAASFAG